MASSKLTANQIRIAFAAFKVHPGSFAVGRQEGHWVVLAEYAGSYLAYLVDESDENNPIAFLPIRAKLTIDLAQPVI